MADSKHGFESRWGHQVDFVVIFAPKFHSPGGGTRILLSLPLVVKSFQSLPNVLLRESGIARGRLNIDVA